MKENIVRGIVQVYNGDQVEKRRYPARRIAVVEAGENWEWGRRKGQRKTLLVPNNSAVRWWNGMRYLEVCDGDILARDFHRSKYGEEVVPYICRGLHAYWQQKALDASTALPMKWLLVGGGAIVAVIIAMQLMGG